MKNVKRSFRLILVVILAFSILNIQVVTADSRGTGIIAFPVDYSFSVDDKSATLWGYEVGGGVYFKLRDLAMALSGTEKQFSVSWAADGSYGEIDLSSGMAYAPVGRELKAPSQTGNTVAYPANAVFYCTGGRAAISAYIVNNAHYVKLSDLAATLKFASVCNEEMRTARIITSPKIASAGIVGEAFDNIALAQEGNGYSLDQDGNVILSYMNGKNTVKAPLTLGTSGSYTPGMEAEDTGFYISAAKTAIAFGGADGPVRVLVSDDSGKTWNTYPVESSKYMGANKHIGFITKDDGFLVASSGSSLGTSYNYVFRTSDGGKTWTQMGNPNGLYPHNMTGAGFSTREIGFISFRVDDDPGPTIYRTMDGGYTWEKLAVTVPDGYDYNIPLSPVFSGANGIYPIRFYSNNGGVSITYYLSSSDYGKTWAYDEKYNLPLTSGTSDSGDKILK